MDSLRNGNEPLDAVDVRLLELLAENARASVAELARSVGMSAPSVSDRIRRLETTGVIRGYTVEVDPVPCGLPISAWLRIRPVPGQLKTVAGILSRLAGIVECDRVTGEDCFLARAQLSSIGELEKLIDEIIPYAMTNTSIIQSTLVPRRLGPFPRAGTNGTNGRAGSPEARHPG